MWLQLNLMRSETSPLHTQRGLNLVSLTVNSTPGSQPSAPETRFISSTHDGQGVFFLLEQTFNTEKHHKCKVQIFCKNSLHKKSRWQSLAWSHDNVLKLRYGIRTKAILSITVPCWSNVVLTVQSVDWWVEQHQC